MDQPTGQILGIFAKEPRPGLVKTRLAEETDPAFAARVADVFLRDTLRKCAHLEADRFVVFTPADARAFFASLAGAAFHLEPQSDGHLGRRLAHFLQTHLQGPGQRAVLVGTDSPTLPLAFLDLAFQELERSEVVLGPATDGGYYLLGCRDRPPPLFDGIPWGGPDVLAATVAQIRAAGLRLALLPPWYDVDTLADWRMLQGHLRALRAAGADPDAPHTENLVQSR